MTERTTFEPSWASPPGDTIADLLEERGWTAAQLAERMEYTPKHINELLHGRATISADTALRLEAVLGASAQFWLNRESQYREATARREKYAEWESQAEWLNMLPVSDMKAMKWIPPTSAKPELVAECFRFFGVNSVEAWKATYSKPIDSLAAFRASTKHQMQLGAVAAWLRQGEIEAGDVATAQWDRSKFQSVLSDVRALTLESDPVVFLPKLQDLCASAGVALATVKAPRGCPASGATKFLSPSKALLLMSFRYLVEDSFWFSFFHEAGHLLLHPKRTMFIEVSGKDTPAKKDEHEAEADQFAQDFLVPPSRREELKSLRNEAEIRAFATSVGVSPGIIVGQLNHHGLVPWKHLWHLKVRYRWQSSTED